MIFSSCPKEHQQDIWCNTIAGSVPRGALCALCCKTTGTSSLALLLLSREQHTLCNTSLQLRMLHHNVFRFVENWFLSHLLHWPAFISVMVLHCWRMSSLMGSLQLSLGCLVDVSGGDWMICSGVVTPRWSMLDKQCCEVSREMHECSCSPWVKNVCLKCGWSWECEVWRSSESMARESSSESVPLLTDELL